MSAPAPPIPAPSASTSGRSKPVYGRFCEVTAVVVVVVVVAGALLVLVADCAGVVVAEVAGEVVELTVVDCVTLVGGVDSSDVVAVVVEASGSVYWLSPAEGPESPSASAGTPTAQAARMPSTDVVIRRRGTGRVSHRGTDADRSRGPVEGTR
jgi:hypothetical protein